jgi:hypothetical protein
MESGTFQSASIEASPTSSCCHTHQAKSVHCTLPGPRHDLHHGFNLCGLDHVHLVERSYFRDERMLWSSSHVKKEHRAIEKEMTREINFEVINDKLNNKVVDGVRFDVKQLFRYLVSHFGLAEIAKTGTVEFSITCDEDPLDDLTGHFTIEFKIVDKDAVCPISGKNIFHQLVNM